MKLGFLMIILTLVDGNLSAAFVSTATLEECEDRAAVVRGILEKGEYPIEQMVCRAADVEFEPFSHGMEQSADSQAYLISFDDKAATVEAVASCAAAQVEAGQFCATSGQKIVAAGK